MARSGEVKNEHEWHGLSGEIESRLPKFKTIVEDTFGDVSAKIDIRLYDDGTYRLMARHYRGVGDDAEEHLLWNHHDSENVNYFVFSAPKQEQVGDTDSQGTIATLSERDVSDVVQEEET